MHAKLTQQDADMIRVLAEFTKVRALAIEYDVDVTTIYNILNGKSFTGAPPKTRKDRGMSDDEVREIKRLAAIGLSPYLVGKATGRSTSTCRNVMTGKTYKDISL